MARHEKEQQEAWPVVCGRIQFALQLPSIEKKLGLLSYCGYAKVQSYRVLCPFCEHTNLSICKVWPISWKCLKSSREARVATELYRRFFNAELLGDSNCFGEGNHEDLQPVSLVLFANVASISMAKVRSCSRTGVHSRTWQWAGCECLPFMFAHTVPALPLI